jgi:6-pyruvoyltetrahydropterin/6-carboxytetrahydropterin synthase
MKTTVTRELHFCAAHRLYQYVGKCHNLHGHNYKVLVTISGTAMNNMILDFGKIKEVLQTYLNYEWDHCTILNSTDPLCKELSKWGRVLTFDGDPTAELMSETLLGLFTIEIGSIFNCKVESVLVYETEESYAESK